MGVLFVDDKNKTRYSWTPPPLYTSIGKIVSNIGLMLQSRNKFCTYRTNKKKIYRSRDKKI